MKSLLLILISLSSFAQDFSYVNRKAAVSRNITDIDVSFLNVYYTDETISITAHPNQHISAWQWEVRSSTTNTLIASSTEEDPEFDGSELGLGYFDLILNARNGIDYYPRVWRRAFRVFKPKVVEGSADLVINISSGSYFRNFTGEDWSDKTIFIKGTNANAYVELYNLQGTAGHPVYIHKADDNVKVEWTFSGGSGHVWWLSGYSNNQYGCRYITINGFNADGTPGIRVNGATNTTQTFYCNGKFTDIELAGVEVTSLPAIDGAAVSLVPTVSSVCNIDNWRTNNIIIYRVDITDAGEEGIYVGESSQNTDYVGNNGFSPPQGVGFVVARCTVTGCGRDGIQPGGQLGAVHDNVVLNWGRQKEASHESCICHNPGSAVIYQGNKCVGGKMFMNILSGLYPYDKMGGETAPRYTLVIGNEFSNGSYDHIGGGAEPFAIYSQNNPISGAGSWNVYFINNVFDTDLKLMEALWALGGFTSNDWTLVNNVIVKVGDAGDWDELNFTGNDQGSQTGATVNNIVRERGSDLSDLYFADYTGYDYTITSLSSAVYGGSPTDLDSTYPEWATYFYDASWFPLDVPIDGFNFGSYSGYQKRTVTPP
jgi:hypothetical protein